MKDEKQQREIKYFIDFYEKHCKYCGICVKVCPVKNLEIVKGEMLIRDKCIGCGLCEKHCPDLAIFVYKIKDCIESEKNN